MINMNVRPSIATDTHPVYEPFAVLSSMVWRERIGFEPLVTLVGYEEEWLARPRSRFVMDTLRGMDIKPLFVRVPEGYRSANVAQIARMYAPLELDPDDVAITSDIDMWPVDRDWFCRHLPNPGQVTTYYGNFPSRFPMCYVAANATTWCNMHGLDWRDYWGQVDKATSIHMLHHLRPETSPPDAWQHDEEYLTARIHALGAARINMIRRPDGDPFPDRIDRVRWPANPRLTIASVKDAHLLRPAHQHWFALGELFELLAPSMIGWADKFVAMYATLLNKDPT